jgi:hypothetical protein
LAPRRLAQGHSQLSKPVDRERHGDEDRQPADDQPGGVQKQEREQQCAGAPDPGAALRDRRPPPESLSDLGRCTAQKKQARHTRWLRGPDRREERGNG